MTVHMHQADLVAGSRLADYRHVFCTSLLQSSELRLHRNRVLHSYTCVHRQIVLQCTCLVMLCKNRCTVDRCQRAAHSLKLANQTVLP